MDWKYRFWSRRFEGWVCAAVFLVLIPALAVKTNAVAANPGSASSTGLSTGGGDFSPIGEPHAFKSVRRVYEWRFEARRGPSPFDRIGLHRIDRGPRPPAKPDAVILYLPGTHMNGEVAVDDPRYSLALYMAQNGVDFWALDYRTHFIPPATPQAGLAELKDWTADLFESDIDAAVRFVLGKTGSKKLYLAGFSRGVTFAYLYAALHPGRVAGLVIFDGYIPRRKAAQPPPGRYAKDIGGRELTYDKRQALLEAAIKNPGGPAPLPKYKTASQNLEAVVYDSAAFGGHGGLANPQGGFSDPVILARVLIAYDRYWPAVQDYENPFTPLRIADLGLTGIPVLAFSSTNISKSWPEKVAASAQLTGSVDTATFQLKGWGHLDVICGTGAQQRVYGEALTWIRQHQMSVGIPN